MKATIRVFAALMLAALVATLISVGVAHTKKAEAGLANCSFTGQPYPGGTYAYAYCGTYIPDGGASSYRIRIRCRYTNAGSYVVYGPIVAVGHYSGASCNPPFSFIDQGAGNIIRLDYD